MTANLYCFEKLLNATSQAEIFNFLEHQGNQLGYSGYVYAQLIDDTPADKVFRDDSKILDGDELIKQNFFTTYPCSWLQRYQEAGYQHSDPTLRLTADSNLPLIWDDISRRLGTQVVLDEARQHGLANGITVPVRGRNRGRALFSFATELAPETNPGHAAANAGMVVMTALHLHEALQRQFRKTSTLAVPKLTLRETDCLEWAANGKTSWEIAHILSVSERTVVFHIANATKKLDATNRRQAVARAISLNIIHP